MQRPGIIKQLQLYLTISILLNILLTQQIFNLRIKEGIKPETKKEKSIKEKSKTVSLPEEDLRDFIQEYLENFFSIEESSLDYLQSHTDIELYESTIKTELLNRQKQKIQSKFNLEDIYIEAINDKQVKAICIGIEDFLAGDYISRNFTIEFIVDATKFKIVSIPVFKVN